MTSLEPRYSKKEFAQRGRAIYERDVHPYLTDGDRGKFVAIDIETGKIAYVALSVGGVLGVGEKLFAVPYNQLAFDHVRVPAKSR